MTVEGLKATKVLSSEGIKVNVTLIFPQQTRHFLHFQELVHLLYPHSLAA